MSHRGVDDGTREPARFATGATGTETVDAPAQLRLLLRDLLALLALPAMCNGRGPAETLALALDAIEAVLPESFVYARVSWSDEALELLRRGGQDAPAALPAVRAALEGCLDHGAPTAVSLPGRPLGAVRAAVAPLALLAERGAIVVGSRRLDFPDPNDMILLRAAASLAAGSLDTARALAERERASRAKDEFLAMLGHELRNPLAPIVTAMELLRDPGGGEPRRELRIIERQVGHLLRLVDDLLDISRITRGKVDLALRPVEVAAFVARGIEMASPLIEQRRHHLRVEVPAGLVVEGDETRLAQVVSNLLSNAAKYTPPGGHIEVLAGDEDEAVLLRVRDDGGGVAPDLLPCMFDIFVRSRGGLSQREGGLGLGLTIVKNLVQLHGGQVWARSDGPGAGCEVSVRLPLHRAHVAAARPLPAAAGLALPRGGRALRLLVVDDNEDAAQLLAELLRLAGHEVAIAHDCARALQALEEQRPDVAILDLGLPVMDGWELAARIRARHGDAAPGLIALTGYGQEGDRARSAAAGFGSHLVKPVGVVELLEAVAAAARRDGR
ncbi:MAG: ATP-binding protein [Planctomycetes bacterium]|nr:ATP-binding protein [Planctomycetota bacterium]